MNSHQFISRFLRLNPSLNVVIQRNKPDCLPQGKRFFELKTDKNGMDYFDKGIFRFQETENGFTKNVVTPRIKSQLVEDVVFGDNTLCRRFYDESEKQKIMFCYEKVSDCIREEIFDEYNELKERSIYHANSDNDIDFPEIHFRGKLSHRWPVYLLEKYQISFGENCTRSTYGKQGELTQQEIHKSGKIVRIQQKRNCLCRLLCGPRAKVSYAENVQGVERVAMIERLKNEGYELPRSVFLRMRHDSVSFYHKKHQNQR